MREGRILIVDDEPMVRETLAQVMLDEGYAVDTAVDGRSALAAVQAHRPDVILLDLMMPGMNGRQFLTELRSQPEHADLPVLLMTAVHGLNINLAHLGASEVVEKPFDVEELLNKIALVVYRTRDGSAPAIPTPPPSAAPSEPGVVLLVEPARERLQRLETLIGARGFTVLTMTRATAQLAGLARALRPVAVVVNADAADIVTAVRALAVDPLLGATTIIAYGVRTESGTSWPDRVTALPNATDEQLVDLLRARWT